MLTIKELVHNLPTELCSKIISYISIEYLLDNESSIPPSDIIDERIINYINNKLLSDMLISGYLLNNQFYKDIVNNKLDEIILNYTNIFMNYVNINGGIINYNNNSSLISLNFEYTYTTIGEFFNSNTDDYCVNLSNYSHFDNHCSMCIFNRVFNILYDENNIKQAIHHIIKRNMNVSDTTCNIKSIKIVKSNLLNDIINENNTVLIKLI
jgi:hypothetical protein